MNITPIRIKKIREKLNLTQQELATILGVTKNTVWRYEDGRCNLTDELSNKLQVIYVSLQSDEDKKFLLSLRKSVGGISVITGLLAIWSTIHNDQVTNGGPIVLFTEMLKSPVGQTLKTILLKV